MFSAVNSSNVAFFARYVEFVEPIVKLELPSSSLSKRVKTGLSISPYSFSKAM